MKQLIEEIQQIEKSEYLRAAEKFGRCNNSQHESYAVILEEFEEAQEQSETFAEQLECFWQDVKCNQNEFVLSRLLNMRNCAEKAASEWVQVAAMCYKAMQKKDD